MSKKGSPMKILLVLYHNEGNINTRFPEKLNKVIIIGHEHPAISFPDRPDERYKCFIKGKYKNHDLLVTPSFSFLSQGTDIKREQLLSPFLKQSLKDFEIYIVEDKVYKFGKLTNTF